MNKKGKFQIVEVPVEDLKFSSYNPRKWDSKATATLTESIRKFGIPEPIIVNSAPNRKNIIIGGHFRLQIARNIGGNSIFRTKAAVQEEKDGLKIKWGHYIKFGHSKTGEKVNVRVERKQKGLVLD